MVAWRWGLGAAGVGRLTVVAVFSFRSPATLGPIGLEPARNQAGLVKASVAAFAAIMLTVIGLAGTGVITLDPAAIGQNMTVVLVGIGVLYFAYIFIAGGLTGDEMKRMGVIIVLFVFSSI